jgi:cellulose synthase/poly-beta-1,6-N-acetylglucosamine synthase-like glycosyltransferase
LQQVLIWSYVIPAGWMMAFAINLYILIAFSVRRRRQMRREIETLRTDFALRYTDADLPRVTTQIPVYNEFNVIERCMRACAAMDYPRHLHTLQVLDDSTDATRELIDRIAEELRAGGVRVDVFRRANRIGYKAGALDAGMSANNDPFVAIFDADFVPPAHFLRRMIEVMLMKEDVGMVQARWGHLNETENLLTRTQGIGIDGHFTVEQTARAWNDLIMNFNGTAGMWRRQAIEDAGGWEHDTLTEDLDLSYRAQLNKWKPYFLVDVVVPAEIPGDINAFKSQQFRWAKGSIETAKKLLPAVLASDLPLFTKLQSFLHMTHYMVHPIMLWLSLMALPVLKFTWYAYYSYQITLGLIMLIAATMAPTVMYAVSQCGLHHRPWRRLALLPVLSVLGVGIAISNSQAVYEALRGRKSAFVRTPKSGDASQKSKVNYQFRMPKLAILEILLGAYCMATTVEYFQEGRLWVVPFLLIYSVGFTWVGLMSVVHHLQAHRSVTV